LKDQENQEKKRLETIKKKKRVKGAKLKETRIQRGKENKLPPSWVSRLHSQ